MNIYFDIDYTLISMTGKLRPRVHEVFQALKDDGHELFIWSGIGYRGKEVQDLGLEPYVSGVYAKPLSDYVASLPQHGVTEPPHFVVDDYPEIVSIFGGFVIKPYYMPNPEDREMDRVYRAITSFHQEGHSTEPGFQLQGTFPNGNHG